MTLARVFLRHRVVGVVELGRALLLRASPGVVGEHGDVDLGVRGGVAPRLEQKDRSVVILRQATGQDRARRAPAN